MNDDQIRTLLDDAVADVRPRHALADIRSRTANRRRRSWAWGVGGAAVATAATVAAVVALTQGTPGSAPAPADRPAAAPGPTVEVYYVGDTGAGPRLFPELRATGSEATAVDDALTDAVHGISSDDDYRSPWPRGTTMQRAQLSRGVLSVDLSGPVTQRPGGMSRTEAALALQQLVYSAQAATGSRQPVTFLVDGRRADSVLGLPVRRPVAAAPADATVTAVSVLLPPGTASGEVSPFTVEGRASTFEGTVQWELVQHGRTVRRGYATARECCRLAPYSFRVTAPPGDYTLVVHDEDVSDGEGVGVTQDTKPITVR